MSGMGLVREREGGKGLNWGFKEGKCWKWVEFEACRGLLRVDDVGAFFFLIWIRLVKA